MISASLIFEVKRLVALGSDWPNKPRLIDLEIKSAGEGSAYGIEYFKIRSFILNRIMRFEDVHRIEEFVERRKPLLAINYEMMWMARARVSSNNRMLAEILVSFGS